jgi:hypothetical protein
MYNSIHVRILECLIPSPTSLPISSAGVCLSASPKGPSEAYASSPSVKAPIAIITLLLSDSSTFTKADELK